MTGTPISRFSGPFALPKALDLLLRDEYAMGNGQCGECCGLGPRFYGGIHSRHGGAKAIGHKPGCKKAEAIESLDWHVWWAGE